ncbi:DUF397 domain-containing protein [Nocardiopsis exhalans]|uniref:DUF397 domain-containing protein n=3 Tax=Nocardiopsis TaxID=2013 RepID=A0A840WNQ2_9ACTN|nr:MULTISPECIES: DUF397 domain-containing protein [Nocardiopsis]MBB5493405.1 hypothetical protein [Nocardiopsis metallicus]MCK9873022.1 DUF397 domain-containing protein [Nocardiopsis dassonvillei]MEE2051618.1 DUF397 domain-containing protein [Nocardiopsis umidischolae]USY19856.1 DUF397 domain-containing protein [Nocardiopsis exhalans]
MTHPLRRTADRDFVFRKASYSTSHGQDCVEVGDLPGVSAVRDTRHRELGALLFPSGEWSGLVAAAKRVRS